MLQKYWVKVSVALLLVIMAVQVALSTRQQSPSWDEGDHIFSGYMNWKTGEYDLNPEHPPLVKLIATLPLLALHLKIPPREGRRFKAEAYFGGRELLFRNDRRYGGLYTADTLLFRVHMAALVFGLGLGLLLFLATAEMFGPTAGLIALAIFVFDPSILAHAPYVATDTGAACGFSASVYTLYRFVKRPTPLRAVLCGIAVGLALCTKHSTVLLLPMFLLLIAGELVGQWLAHRTFPRREMLRILAGLAAIAAVAMFVLWGIYGFRFSMHPAGFTPNQTMPPLAAKLATVSPLLGKTITFCANHHLLPESYLYGLADVQEVGLNTPTYILGRVYEHGVWYYFPVLLSLKWTAGFLGLLGLAIYGLFGKGFGRRREIFFLALPAVFYLLVAIVEGLNIGVRHILPIFPFTFALTGAGIACLLQQRRAWAYLVAILLLLHAVDSLRCFPNYIPYANAFWGGPSKTNLYFTDSATDWAQQLKWTKQWLGARNIHDCYFAYFAAPFLLPSDYGIPCKPLPTLDTMWEEDLTVPATLHGPVLVSYGDLNGFEFGSSVQNPYQPLFLHRPDDVILNSIAVFYGDVSLPDAAALQYIVQSKKSLGTSPPKALALARQAVAASPRGFDSNLALTDAALAANDIPTARAAFATVNLRFQQMEPSAQTQWAPELQKRQARLETRP